MGRATTMPRSVEITHSTGTLHVFACAHGARKHGGATVIRSSSRRAYESIRAGKVCQRCLGGVPL